MPGVQESYSPTGEYSTPSELKITGGAKLFQSRKQSQTQLGFNKSIYENYPQTSGSTRLDKSRNLMSVGTGRKTEKLITIGNLSNERNENK